MRIVVDVLLNLEHLVLSLQVHADTDVQGLVLVGQCVVVGILHVAACKLIPLLHVDIVLHEVCVEVFDDEVLTLQVNDGALSTFLVYQHDRTDTGFLGYEGIVSTEVWSDMYDTGTVVRCHIVAGNHLKGITHRFDSGHQLLILHTDEVSTLVASHDTIGNQLLTPFVLRQLTAIGDSTLGRQIGIQTGLCQNDGDGFGGIGIVGLDGYIVNLRTYTQCGVRCQRPRRGRPCQEIRCTPLSHLRLRVLHLELCRTCCIFHVTIATGLVQLMT